MHNNGHFTNKLEHMNSFLLAIFYIMQLVLITFESEVQNTKSVGFNNFMMDAFTLFLYSEKTTGRRNLYFANSRVNNESHFTNLQIF